MNSTIKTPFCREVDDEKVVIGMIGDIDEKNALEFYLGIADELDIQNSGFEFLPTSEICVSCVHNFIISNSVDILFLENSLTFNEYFDVDDVVSVISHIGVLCDCKIYFIRNLENS